MNSYLTDDRGNRYDLHSEVWPESGKGIIGLVDSAMFAFFERFRAWPTKICLDVDARVIVGAITIYHGVITGLLADVQDGMFLGMTIARSEHQSSS